MMMVLMLVYLFATFSTFFTIYSALRLDMCTYYFPVFFTIHFAYSHLYNHDHPLSSRFSTTSFPLTIRLLFLDSFLNHRHALISLAFIAKMYFWVFVQPHQSKKETSKERACKYACIQITYKYYTYTNYIAFVIVVAATV